MTNSSFKSIRQIILLVILIISYTNCLKQYKCKNNIKENENIYCPAIYKPVCGLFGDNVKCKKAPCGKTFSNSCEACADKDVIKYI